MSVEELREKLPYRPCVGVVVFNKDGKVFSAKRKGTGPSHNQFEWQLPQGGVDKGEDAEKAAFRELYEETNISSVELIEKAPKPFYYDLPDELIGVSLKGKYRGQKQDWFALRFTGDDSEINVKSPANGQHPAEFSDWAWRDLAEMPDLIVPFKRDVYVQVVSAFTHLSR